MGARFKRNKKAGRKIYRVFSQHKINTGKGPDQNVLDEYRARTSAMTVDAETLSRIEKAFGVNHAAVKRREDSNEKLRVFGHQKFIEQLGFPWTGERHHGLHLFVREKIVETEVRELSLYFFMEQAFFLEYKKISGIVRRSIIYKGRDNALLYHRAGHLHWLAYTKTDGG